MEHIGFLTLTFEDQNLPIRECARRLNSFMTGFLRSRVVRGIRVLERNKKGAVHYHLVIAFREDIRSGVNFEEFRQDIWRSAPRALLNWWKLLRDTLPKYKFGWHELYPIEKPDAVGIYVGKYIGKHITVRMDEDKGARLVSFFGYKRGDRVSAPQFAFAKGFPKLWRAKVGAFCRARGIAEETHQADLKKHFGPRWCFYLQEQIMDTRLTSEELAKLDLPNPTEFQGSNSSSGVIFPRDGFRSWLRRPSTRLKGVGSRQRTTNQNASQSILERRFLSGSGGTTNFPLPSPPGLPAKVPIEVACARFQEALRAAGWRRAYGWFQKRGL